MGTSSPYSPPSGGDWSKLKTDLTNLTHEPTNAALRLKVLDSFIDTIGGASGFASSNKMGAKGGSFNSATGRKVAHSLGSFLASVQNKGLEETLKERNLEYLTEKNIDEIKEELVNYLADPAIDGDSIAARKAIDKVLDERLRDIEDIEEFEKKLNSIELESVLCDFFANYISELFFRTFEEEYQNKNNVEPREAARVLKEVEKDIKERVKSYQIDKPLAKLDWKSQEAQTIIQEILRGSLESIKGE